MPVGLSHGTHIRISKSDCTVLPCFQVLWSLLTSWSKLFPALIFFKSPRPHGTGLEFRYTVITTFLFGTFTLQQWHAHHTSEKGAMCPNPASFQKVELFHSPYLKRLIFSQSTDKLTFLFVVF